MLMMRSAPASAWMVVGPVGYQMSSQMLAAMTTSPTAKMGYSVPAWK